MTNLLVWGPRRSLFRTTLTNPFSDDVEATFDQLVRRTSALEPRRGFTPSAEIVREGEDAVVRVELPGVDVTKDVTVEVDGRKLVVRGERRDKRSSGDVGPTWREVRYGSFRRSFTLPQGVNAEAVSAGYDAGVLSVRVAGAYAPATSSAQRVEIATSTTAGIETAPADEPTEA